MVSILPNFVVVQDDHFGALVLQTYSPRHILPFQTFFLQNEKDKLLCKLAKKSKYFTRIHKIVKTKHFEAKELSKSMKEQTNLKSTLKVRKFDT